MEEQSFPQKDRLRKRLEYLHTQRTGRRVGSQHFTIAYTSNGLGHARLGVTASRKTGPAVARNRVKRLARECFRRWSARRGLSLDLVVIFRPGAAAAPTLAQDLARGFARLEPRRAAGEARP
ncbi:MAG: ribonuclease P protein component [Deltaproteobacteria bacterium]|nr:ribonuclease P protein component [Deltaproteobacteria bacterium]